MQNSLEFILLGLAAAVPLGALGAGGCGADVYVDGPSSGCAQQGCGAHQGCGDTVSSCAGTACTVHHCAVTGSCGTSCTVSGCATVSGCSTSTVSGGCSSCSTSTSASCCTGSCGCCTNACSSCCTGDSCCGGNASCTPLVLSFDGAPVDFRADDQHGFAITPMSAVTDWPTAKTPWLAMDRDGDGRITSGEELFGSMTKLADGTVAKNGFQALRDLDENHDGVIDAKDPAFAKLVVWSDRDADRASSPSELEPAADVLVSIDLDYGIVPRCDLRGNCEIERATFRYEDASGAVREGAVIDVHVKPQRLRGL